MRFRNYVIQNFPFLEDDFDALTDYQLFCKLVGYAKKMCINNEKFVNELTANLEKMYEDGKFDTLIEEIVNLQTTFTYDSVSDMKDATNLMNGAYARTSGFYSYNDGGGAYYKIRTKTNEDTIDEVLLIAIGDDLVAELIITSEMEIKQFGAKDDDTFDNTSIFKKAIANFKNKLSFNGNTFKIDETIDMLDKNNKELNFNCKIHMVSNASPGTACFRILRCNNIKIDGYDVFSERNQEEPPFGDTSRISPYGSNIYGLVIRSCKDIYVNNVNFNNMAIDFVVSIYDLDSLQEYPNSENIYITNYSSTNASNNNLLAYTKNIYYKNCNLTPAINMGGGDHGWYITDDVVNVYLDNISYELLDGNFGVIFQCNASETDALNVNISNCNIKACRLCYNKHDTVMTFNNINFYDNANDDHANLVLSGSTALTIINNLRVDNLSRPIISTNYGLNLKMKNSIINSVHTGNLFSLGGTNITQSLLLDNCELYNVKAYLVYSGESNTSDVKILNCYIETDSENSISKRKTESKLLISNTQIINSNADPGGLIYNGSFDASNIVTINSYFKNYSRYIYNNTNGYVLNSYLDNTEITD